MLHDFDYEQNPTEDTHLHVGGRVLRERGYAEEMVKGAPVPRRLHEHREGQRPEESDLRL